MPKFRRDDADCAGGARKTRLRHTVRRRRGMRCSGAGEGNGAPAWYRGRPGSPFSASKRRVRLQWSHGECAEFDPWPDARGFCALGLRPRLRSIKDGAGRAEHSPDLPRPTIGRPDDERDVHALGSIIFGRHRIRDRVNVRPINPNKYVAWPNSDLFRGGPRNYLINEHLVPGVDDLNPQQAPRGFRL